MEINHDNVASLLTKYGALQHPSEAIGLIQHLKNTHVRNFVEVGVWKGGFCATIQTLLPEVRVVGVDLLTENDPPMTESPSRKEAMTTGFTFIQGNSQLEETVQKVLTELKTNKVDFVFIDAAHDFDSVKKDYQTWSKVSHEVGFHDLLNENGVYPFWLTLLENPSGVPKLRNFGMWKETDGLGIGVV